MEPSRLLPARSNSRPAARPASRPENAFAGRVVDLAIYRTKFAKTRRDAAIDEQWDSFLTSAKEAWSWRDPESLAAIELCLAILKAETAADWEG